MGGHAEIGNANRVSLKKNIKIMSMKSFLKKSFKKIRPVYKIYKVFMDWKNRDPEIHDIPDMLTKRNDMLAIINEYDKASTFIETGTCFGDTIEFFKNKFAKLYSIELSEDLANKAIKRFSGDKNIVIVQGNSAEQLCNILKEVETTCVFWLDGHYSNEFWVGDEYIVTARGKKITPILEELLHIAKHKVKNHIILIDDARLFTGRHEYPTIAKVKRIVSKKFPRHLFEIEKDIIRILPGK